MKKIFLLTIGMFALGFDAYVIAGLLPAIGQTFKTNPSEVGQSVAAFTFCYALAAPLFATLLAGKPVRNILILALAIFSLGNMFSALASNLTMLLFARAIAGIGAGLYAPVAATGATQLVDAKKRGRALGMILGGMSSGVVIGVPVGLLIAHYLSWQITLWMVTGLGLSALGCLWIHFPNIPAISPPSVSERLAMLLDKKVAATILVTFFASIASLGLYTYIALVLQTTIGTTSYSPYLWMWGLGGIIGSFSIGSLIDLTRQPRLLMLGILIMLNLTLFFLPLGLTVHTLGFLFFIIWGSLGWASQAPQQHTLLAIQPKQGAAVVALNSSANYLGSAVGASLGGFVLWQGLSPIHLPIAAAGMAMIALLIQFVIYANEKRTSMKFATMTNPG